MEEKELQERYAEIEDVQRRLVELSYKKDELKKQYEELNTELEQILNILGVGHFFQDKEGTVYKVVVPKGTLQLLSILILFVLAEA